MAATTATSANTASTPETSFVSLPDFLIEYTNREDPYKYEWNGGVVEQKLRTMNRDQLFIFQNLVELLMKVTKPSMRGLLACEVDMFLPFANRTRRADIAYLTGEQMSASRDGKPTVCPFVIEVISKNDQANEVEEKKMEYFENGVQVLWVMYPTLKKVDVYRSVKEVTVCSSPEDVCSAAPVLPDFEITIQELFA